MRAKGEPSEHVLARIFPLTIDRGEGTDTGGEMPHRQFTDSKRTTWEVWDVDPGDAERRREEDRRGLERKSGERRQRVDRTRVRVKSDLSHGWLAFESKHDRRRLAPIPTGWEALDAPALEQLCEQAASIGRRKRLLE
jgi:hypothetical protein